MLNTAKDFAEPSGYSLTQGGTCTKRSIANTRHRMDKKSDCTFTTDDIGAGKPTAGTENDATPQLAGWGVHLARDSNSGRVATFQHSTGCMVQGEIYLGAEFKTKIDSGGKNGARRRLIMFH